VNQIAPHRASVRLLDTPTGPLALLDTGVPTGPAPQAPVLLVPGYTGSKEDFAPLVDPLASLGHRVVAMDQRGQFESPGVAEPAAYTMAALAADVLSVADDLAGDAAGPVHLVGHSFGGLVARLAVITRPAAVRSLVLLGSGPAAIGGVRRTRMDALEPVLASGGLPAVHAVLELLAQADPTWLATPPRLREFLRRRFLGSHEVGLRAMGDALRTEPDRVAALAATGVPVLVAYGAADDAWPPQVQTEMARRLGAAVAVIPAAAHSPAVENPAEVVRALASFWRSHSRRSSSYGG